MKINLGFKSRSVSTLNILLVLLALSPQIAISSSEHTKENAVGSVRTFAHLIEIGSLEEAFLSSSVIMQKASNQHDWIDQKKRTLDLFGEMKSRKLIKTRRINTFPYLPDNDYLLVYHDIEMENKRRAIEVAVVRNEDGQWKICSYSMR